MSNDLVFNPFLSLTYGAILRFLLKIREKCLAVCQGGRMISVCVRTQSSIWWHLHASTNGRFQRKLRVIYVQWFSKRPQMPAVSGGCRISVQKMMSVWKASLNTSGLGPPINHQVTSPKYLFTTIPTVLQVLKMNHSLDQHPCKKTPVSFCSCINNIVGLNLFVPVDLNGTVCCRISTWRPQQL